MIPLHKKLYVWSIVTEPLLFFILLDYTNFTAIPVTLSRLFQFTFVAALVYKLLISRKSVYVPDPSSPSFIRVTLFCTYIFLVTLVGLLSGNYESLDTDILAEVKDYKGIFGSYAIRPYFEVFLNIYYVVYFIVIPKYIFTNTVVLDYFMRIFKYVFIFGLVLGIVDLVFSYFGSDLIPRHLVDTGWVENGFRFHGFAGEPRDAYAYLCLGLAVYVLHSYLNGSKVGVAACMLLLVCAVMTQSMSALVGAVIGIGLYLLVMKYSPKNIVLFIVLCTSLVSIILFSVGYSYRMQAYMEYFVRLDEIMRSGRLPTIILAQSPDIVPIWLYWDRLVEFDLGGVLFGSGMASASVATNNFMGLFDGLNNPRSQIIRMVFETGLFGLLLYIIMVLKPIRNMTSRLLNQYSSTMLLASSILIGSCLGHRSNCAFIFAGLATAISANDLLYHEKIANRR